MSESIVSIEERRPRPQRRWVRWAVLAGIVAIAASLAWVLWFSPVLSVRQVRVVGAPAKLQAEVAAAAAVPIGQPLARVDADAVAARLGALDWVGSVEVRRGWPSEVVLAVQPRTAIAVQSGTGKGVDAQGTAFTAPQALPKGLPKIDATGEPLAQTVQVLNGLPQPLRAKVVSMSASTRDDIAFELRSGAEVRWGSVDQPEFKAQVLTALLGRRARMYDVTAPELPTTFAEHPKAK